MFKKKALLILFALFCCNSAFGAYYCIWNNGAGTGDWNTPGNWNAIDATTWTSSNRVPGDGDAAVVGAPGATPPNGVVIHPGTNAVAWAVVDEDWGIGWISPGISRLTMLGGTFTGDVYCGNKTTQESIWSMSGGTINCTTLFSVAGAGKGTFTMTGGTINAPTLSVPGSGGRALLHLDGGTINASSLNHTTDWYGYGPSIIDINDGMLTLTGNATSQIQSLITSGNITAFNNNVRAEVVVDYDVRVAGKTVVTAKWSDPNIAYNPNPANGSTYIPYTLNTISWNHGDNAVTSKVYFGTADGLSLVQTSAANTYVFPAELDLGIQYFWRVDEVDSLGVTHTGKTWNFTVEPYLEIDGFANVNGWQGFCTWGCSVQSCERALDILCYAR